MLKTNLVLGIMLIMLLAVSASLMAYSGGAGTSEDPYQIANKTDLKYLSENTGEWAKHFIQTADITFTDADFESGGNFYNIGAGFIPIGTWGNYFTGSYNGNGYKITNLFINRPGVDFVGFIGMIESPGSLSNIGMENVDITGKQCVGGLAGRMTSTIENCYVKGGTVTGELLVGGLMGYDNNLSTSSISKCYSSANVSGTGYGIGGLIGSTVEPPSECFSTGDVSGESEVGGLIGNLNIVFFDEETLGNCYSKGDVTRSSGAFTSIGAFIGLVIVDKNLGQRSRDEVGILVIQNCYSIGSVDCGGATDKGFVGELYPDAGIPTYNDNFFDADVSNQTTATGATVKTTTQMKTENFVNVWGWSSEIWERIGYNYPRLIDNPDPTLPVTLSSFTVQYLNDTPTLCWTTQSETSNLGWNVYRSEIDILEEAIQINTELIPGAGTTSEPTDYIYEDEAELMENTEYWYWLESIDYSGLTESYGSISLIIPEEGEEPGSPEIPEIYGLHQNYPNPFNPSTEISFIMKESCICELSIYNIKGQKIKTIFSNLSITGDELIIYNWNGKDETGRKVSTGVYYYKLRTSKGDFVRKMILMK